MKSRKIRASECTAQLFTMRAWFYFWFLLMLTTLVFSYEAMAFRQNSAKNLENRIAVLSTQLQLTDAQVEQIRPILEHQVQKRKEIFEAYSLQGNADRRALTQEMRALREDTHLQITDLLTEEQIAKYEAWRQARYQQMRDRGAMRRNKPGRQIY